MRPCTTICPSLCWLNQSKPGNRWMSCPPSRQLSMPFGFLGAVLPSRCSTALFLWKSLPYSRRRDEPGVHISSGIARRLGQIGHVGIGKLAGRRALCLGSPSVVANLMVLLRVEIAKRRSISFVGSQNLHRAGLRTAYSAFGLSLTEPTTK